MSSSKPSTTLPPSTKTVLITGCSKDSIGSSLSLAFSRRPGFHVFSTARSLTHLTHLSSVPNITCIELDITSPTSVASAVSFIKERTGGRLDYLINNAGLAYRSPAMEGDEKEARRVMEVNFWGTVRMCEAFGGMVVEARGTVVNVGSVSGRVGGAWMAFYAASKAALDVYTSALRAELAPFGVGVLLILAGAVGTPMNNASSTTTSSYTLPSQESIFYPARESIPKAKLGRRMKPDEFAEKVVRDVLGGKTGLSWRGAFASLVWFILTFCPGWVMDKLTRDGPGLELLGRE